MSYIPTMEHEENLQLPTEAPVAQESNAEQPQALNKDMPEEAVAEPLREPTEGAEKDTREEPVQMLSQESTEAAASLGIPGAEPEAENQELVNKEVTVHEASDDNTHIECEENLQLPAEDPVAQESNAEQRQALNKDMPEEAVAKPLSESAEAAEDDTLEEPVQMPSQESTEAAASLGIPGAEPEAENQELVNKEALGEEHAESEEVPAKESEQSSAPLTTKQLVRVEAEPEPECDAHQAPAEGPVQEDQESAGTLPEEPQSSASLMTTPSDQTEAEPKIEPTELTDKEGAEEQTSEAKAKVLLLAVTSLSAEELDKQPVEEEKWEPAASNESIAALEPTEPSVQATEGAESHQEPAEESKEPAPPEAEPESESVAPESKKVHSSADSEDDVHLDPAEASLEDKREAGLEPSAPLMATQSVQTDTEPESAPGRKAAEEGAPEAKTGQSEQDGQGESSSAEKSASSEGTLSKGTAPTKRRTAVLKVARFADLKRQDSSVDACQPNEPLCTHCARPATSASLVWETMLFCNDQCLEQYIEEKHPACRTCSKQCPLTTRGRYCVRFGDSVTQFCSAGCLDKHKKNLRLCSYCQQSLAAQGGRTFTQNVQGRMREFCERSCHQQFLLGLLGTEEKAKEAEASRKTHNCTVCGKSSMVECELLALPEDSPARQFCSSACLRVYKFSNSVQTTADCGICQRQFDLRLPHKSVFSQGVAHTFCSTRCQNVHVLHVRQITQCKICKVKKYSVDMIQSWQGQQGIVHCSLFCLRWSPALSSTEASQPAFIQAGAQQQQQIQTIREKVKEVKVFVKEPVKMVNKGTYTRPLSVSKGVTCNPIMLDKGAQTDGPSIPVLVPLTVPTYVPMPMAMYSQPYPVPIPVPVPVPVPVFIPTTRNSIRGIMKQIRKIQAKIPSDPFEAEILAMARALVDGQEDKEHFSTSGNESEDSGISIPGVDKEAAVLTMDKDSRTKRSGGRKRSFSEVNPDEPSTESSPPSKAARLEASAAPAQAADAKHYLKSSYGVNAWKHWIMQKNAELVKARARGQYKKEFEVDLLKLRADELNYTLSMFVQEVKKPNGDSYAPDSVLYLVLGIQKYLSVNGRIDNLFTDKYYEPFVSSLHEVIKDFKLPENPLGSFVTRIDEEHLWESKQLGAHNPQVLLNTLIYFNTKYFMLKTPELHKKLTFSSIMKHWKKGTGAGKKGFLLRYYPHQSGRRAQESKNYEQHENEESPMRCPVKLYDFYLLKCSGALKKSSDLFYLQPERHSLPDSPLWYSNVPLPIAALGKVVERFLMVREVQEQLLAHSA